MSRSGYSDDYDSQGLALWRGQVASAIRGKRGQAFLKEMVAALDAMPEKRLIRDELQSLPPAFISPEHARPQVCAIGSVGLKRNVDLLSLDPEDYGSLADIFGIAHQLVREIEYMNDEGDLGETPEERWTRMYDWACSQIRDVVP